MVRGQDDDAVIIEAAILQKRDEGTKSSVDPLQFMHRYLRAVSQALAGKCHGVHVLRLGVGKDRPGPVGARINLGLQFSQGGDEVQVVPDLKLIVHFHDVGGGLERYS